jgi:ABC-2 type transport system permease protein
LPLALLSGSNTPLESMPPWLATVMQVSPTVHFVSLAQAILYRGAGFAVVWQEFLVVAFIGGIFLVLALLRSARSRLPQCRDPEHNIGELGFE